MLERKPRVESVPRHAGRADLRAPVSRTSGNLSCAWALHQSGDGRDRLPERRDRGLRCSRSEPIPAPSGYSCLFASRSRPGWRSVRRSARRRLRPEPSAVAHPCDGRARQHPQGRHRDDLRPHPAHQDQVRVPDDLHIIKLHAPRAIDHDPALGLARRVGRAPGAPLGVTHVGAVRGRSRECGNATPLLIRSANRGRKRWSTRAATAQHAGRSPRQAAGEERAAPRLPGGCRGAWARRALGVTRSVTRSGTTPTKRSQPVKAGRLANRCSARTSADSPHGVASRTD